MAVEGFDGGVEMTNEELNKKLAEWAGFRPTTIEGMWAFPVGVKVAATHSSCKFTESLDACFKWLVPKLIGFDYQYQTNLKNVRSGWHVMLYDLTDNPYSEKRIEAEAETPSLALCLAIEKLIDGERK